MVSRGVMGNSIAILTQDLDPLLPELRAAITVAIEHALSGALSRLQEQVTHRHSLADLLGQRRWWACSLFLTYSRRGKTRSLACPVQLK